MKIRFINAVCILALILASACKSDNASQLKDKEMMITEKKNIGSKLALYPMPVTVVGAEVNGKVNWLLVAPRNYPSISLTGRCFQRQTMWEA